MGTSIGRSTYSLRLQATPSCGWCFASIDFATLRTLRVDAQDIRPFAVLGQRRDLFKSTIAMSEIDALRHTDDREAVYILFAKGGILYKLWRVAVA